MTRSPVRDAGGSMHEHETMMLATIYRSWDEWLDAVAAADSTSIASHDSDVGEWTGGVEFAQALRIVRGEETWDGQGDVIARAAELVANNIGDVFRDRTIHRFEDAGEDVDVGRWCSGEPRSMIEFRTEASWQRGRVLRVFVDLSFLCHHGASQVRERGVAVLAFLRLLEAARVPVELWGGMVTTPSTSFERIIHCTVIPLHSPGAELQAGPLSFTIAHAGWFRLLGFATKDLEPWPIRRAMGYRDGFGYGRSTVDIDGVRRWWAEFMTPRIGGGMDVVIPSLSCGFDTDSGEGWALNTLVRLGLLERGAMAESE